MAEEGGYHLVARRKRKLDRKNRKSLQIISEIYLLVVSYARERNLFQQEIADGLLRIGIKNVHCP